MSDIFGGHPLQQERPDLRAETLDTRLSDLDLYGKLRLGRDYHELGIDSQTADSLGDAIEATLRGINLGR